MKNIFTYVFILLTIAASICSGERITILTPYYGIEENTYFYGKYGVRLEDSAAMKGIYLQSIDTEKYQYNLFLFHTGNINYSNLDGLNFVYDHYFVSSPGKKNVLGAGVNLLRLDLDGRNVPVEMGTLDAFSLDMDTYSFFVRAGRYYTAGNDKLKLTLMPWIGAQVYRIRGQGLADYPGPGKAPFSVDSEEYYCIAGIKLMAEYCHFIQGELKYNITFNDDSYNKLTAMVNFFLSKNIGLSYRFSYQETSVCEDIYHIFGIALVF